MLAALALGFTSNLCACLTHYGTACGPILFGSGYASIASWWKVGIVVSVTTDIPLAPEVGLLLGGVAGWFAATTR